MPHGRLYAPVGTPAGLAASGLAWLWRLGPVLAAPDRRAVGFGTAEQADELASHVEAGRLAGAVVFAPGAAPATAVVPERRSVSGTARFGPGESLRCQLTHLAGGTPVVTSSLGTHAARVGDVLVLGTSAEVAWSRLDGYWTLGALHPFLEERLERRMVLLPPVGCIRLDDIPGTAQHQAQGVDKPDRRQVRRVRALAKAFGRCDAVLNVAVTSRALQDDGRTEQPLEARWPQSVNALADGVREGAFEPVAHGYLHLDTEALDRGEIEWREFASLDRAEATRRISATVEWQRDVLGADPSSFVAPAWAYSNGALEAAAERSLPVWRRPDPGPLLREPQVHESLDTVLRGINGLDYGPLSAMAAHGLPPTPVLHGGLLDIRVDQLRESRDVVSAARLAVRRDIVRLAAVDGVRWVGAGEYIRLLRAHDSAPVEETE